MTGLYWDFKSAFRGLRRHPSMVVIAVLTLALGIGANTAIFSVLHGVLLTPLPFPDAERVVVLADVWEAADDWGSSMSYANVQDLRDETAAVENLAAYALESVNLATGEVPARVQAIRVDAEFFSILGLPLALGRDFVADDNRQGSAAVAILSHQLWQERLGGRLDVIGTTIRIDSAPHAVIGVASPRLSFVGEPRLLLPMGREGGEPLSRGRRDVRAIARLSADASLDAAVHEMRAVYDRIEKSHPEETEGWTVGARRYETFLSGNSRSSLYFLAAAALAVLLIALVNVANLTLVRAEARQREMSTRLALGAGRSRLLALFLGEGLLLSTCGASLGIAAAFWGVDALIALYGGALPRAAEVHVSGTALALAVSLSVGCGIVLALAGLGRLNLKDVSRGLRGGRRSGASRSSARVRSGLVVAEVALTMILVSGAGLLINSFWRLHQIDLGLPEPERVVALRLSLPESKYPTDASLLHFYEDLEERILGLEGVEAAGLTTVLPFYGGTNITRLSARGLPDSEAHFVELRAVTAGFFDALGLRILSGRNFTATDRQATLPGVIVNQTLAQQLFGDREAVGERLDLSWFGAEDGIEVVGVVGDLRDRGLTNPNPPGFYMPVGPDRAPEDLVVMVRAAGDALRVVPGLRAVLHDLDDEIPGYGIERLSDSAGRLLQRPRFTASLLGLFSGLALLLGAVGIFGVMSYNVGQRTREMGLRIALGARRSQVLGLVLRQGMTVVALGLLLGIGAGLGLSRLVAGLLWEVSPTDPTTFVLVAGLLAFVSALACYLPARRAAATDPQQALRDG